MTIKQYIYKDLKLANTEDEFDKGQDIVLGFGNSLVGSSSYSFYTILQNKNIKQIGIQTLPGVKIYFNSTLYPIIIGNNGYFEISVDNNITISSLYIDAASRSLVASNPAAMLLIDTIEEEDE